MPGNSFGQAFVVTSFGESHGPAIGCVVDGCPSGLALSAADIQKELDRRRPGQSRQVSQRRETDHIQILSGVFEGKTTGAPIGLLIHNHDARSQDYTALKEVFRPGHADYTYYQKYGIRDHCGGGRASARETAMRVAAGAIARQYLHKKCGIEIQGYLSQVGNLRLPASPHEKQQQQLAQLIEQIRREGDSIGAQVTVVAHHVPVGLGEPVFAKLDADIAAAMMSIPAAKAVSIGDGFDVVRQKGSEHRDEMTPEGFLSNHAGGTLGGISTGQPIVLNVAFKPASSITIPGKTVDIHNQAREVVTKGRHDPCVGIRAVPVVEAMLALVLMDHLLRNRSQSDGSRE